MPPLTGLRPLASIGFPIREFCSGSTKPPPPRDGGLIMEETRLTTDEFGVFWSFRNMLEMNNI